MIKKTFERVDEELFIEKLDNGITIYMYPTKKQKTFIFQYLLNMVHV